jgi:hypothetical protein
MKIGSFIHVDGSFTRDLKISPVRVATFPSEENAVIDMTLPVFDRESIRNEKTSFIPNAAAISFCATTRSQYAKLGLIFISRLQGSGTPWRYEIDEPHTSLTF